MIKVVTKSELQALTILMQAGFGDNSTDSRFGASEAGNAIIELAERIKAERAVATLYTAANIGTEGPYDPQVSDGQAGQTFFPE